MHCSLNQNWLINPKPDTAVTCHSQYPDASISACACPPLLPSPSSHAGPLSKAERLLLQSSVSAVPLPGLCVSSLSPPQPPPSGVSAHVAVSGRRPFLNTAWISMLCLCFSVALCHQLRPRALLLLSFLSSLSPRPV